MRLRLSDIPQDNLRSWWIDESGIIAPTCEAGPEFDPFAFQNYGMIKLLLGRNGFEVRWNVHDVDENAQNRVLDWISSAQDRIPLKLTYYYFGWYTELADKENAAQKILATRAFRNVELNRSVTMTRHDVSKSAEKLDLIGTSLREWCNTNRFIESSTMANLKNKFVISKPDETTGVFNYRYVGQNAPVTKIMGRKWVKAVIAAQGQPQATTEAYRAITNRPYHAVLSDGEPRYDRILASMQAPDQDPIWVSYHRLLMPTLDQRGAPIMVCASQFSDANFPLLATG